ncbi:MAG: hypothetical protein H6727_15200 [Myxococcales bacterium]|nr:hypothetical protein [Myxococcales bacterium]
MLDPASSRKTLVVAHRGLFQKAPENTFPAVAAVLEEGFDGVELDVTITRDHQVVCFHDEPEARERLFGDPNFVIHEHTYEELCKKPLATKVSYGSPTFYGGERHYSYPQESFIPKLEDVLAAFGKELFFVLEVKTYGTLMSKKMRRKLVTELAVLVQRYSDISRCVFVSFSTKHK